ncbi:hypothetical protein AAHA92_05703 [Salvia divinorum]|uniref:Uncharacterized protein n=1 Tax=Salvia divinorum TaxID=28513 RepID=A0ABD1I4F0_SALDI
MARKKRNLEEGEEEFQSGRKMEARSTTGFENGIFKSEGIEESCPKSTGFVRLQFHLSIRDIKDERRGQLLRDLAGRMRMMSDLKG